MKFACKHICLDIQFLALALNIIIITKVIPDDMPEVFYLGYNI